MKMFEKVRRLIRKCDYVQVEKEGPLSYQLFHAAPEHITFQRSKMIIRDSVGRITTYTKENINDGILKDNQVRFTRTSHCPRESDNLRIFQLPKITLTIYNL